VGGSPEAEGAAVEDEDADVEDVSMALERKAIAPSNSSGLACAACSIDRTSAVVVVVVANFMLGDGRNERLTGKNDERKVYMLRKQGKRQEMKTLTSLELQLATAEFYVRLCLSCNLSALPALCCAFSATLLPLGVERVAATLAPLGKQACKFLRGVCYGRG